MNSKDGYCLGCFRTLDEIARWTQLNDADKERVYKEIKVRKKCSSEISDEVKT
jgi:predicted Fe-S protein YdhL (DUF1289 family)